MGRIDLPGRERKRRDDKEKVGRLGIGKRRHVLAPAGHFCFAADEKERNVAPQRCGDHSDIFVGHLCRSTTTLVSCV